MSRDGGFSLKIGVCGCLIDASRYRSEWYVIKVFDPDRRPLRHRSSSSSSSSRVKKKKKEKVRTMISTKLLSPISVTESDPLSLCKNHLAIGSSLYCFGGLILDSEKNTHEKVWRLDLDLESPRLRLRPRPSPSGDWNSVPLMKFYKRWEPRTLVLHNKLYVLGGFYSQKSKGTFPIPAEAGWMEEFDPSLQEWKALPNPPFGIYSVPAIAVPLHAKKQILVAYYSDLKHHFLEFYNYDVMSRSWTIFGSGSRCIDDSTPLTGRVIEVGNTIYWPSLEDLQEAEMCTIYAYNLDLDVVSRGLFSARSILDDADTAEHLYCNSEPPGLIHLGGRKFCLLLPSSSRGSYYLNCLVLHLEEVDSDYYYDSQFMTISILSNQKYALPHYIDLWDNVLL